MLTRSLYFGYISIYVIGFLYNTGFYKIPKTIVELLKIFKFFSLPNISQASKIKKLKF